MSTDYKVIILGLQAFLDNPHQEVIESLALVLELEQVQIELDDSGDAVALLIDNNYIENAGGDYTQILELVDKILNREFASDDITGHFVTWLNDTAARDKLIIGTASELQPQPKTSTATLTKETAMGTTTFKALIGALEYYDEFPGHEGLGMIHSALVKSNVHLVGGDGSVDALLVNGLVYNPNDKQYQNVLDLFAAIRHTEKTVHADDPDEDFITKLFSFDRPEPFDYRALSEQLMMYVDGKSEEELDDLAELMYEDGIRIELNEEGDAVAIHYQGERLDDHADILESFQELIDDNEDFVDILNEACDVECVLIGTEDEIDPDAEDEEESDDLGSLVGQDLIENGDQVLKEFADEHPTFAQYSNGIVYFRSVDWNFRVGYTANITGAPTYWARAKEVSSELEFLTDNADSIEEALEGVREHIQTVDF